MVQGRDVEKLDAISRRFARALESASYIRHYEDAARIIENVERLPRLDQEVAELVDEMLLRKQIARRPAADDPAFLLHGDALETLLLAHRSIEPMFWGERSTLEEACEVIVTWLT